MDGKHAPGQHSSDLKGQGCHSPVGCRGDKSKANANSFISNCRVDGYSRRVLMKDIGDRSTVSDGIGWSRSPLGVSWCSATGLGPGSTQNALHETRDWSLYSGLPCPWRTARDGQGSGEAGQAGTPCGGRSGRDAMRRDALLAAVRITVQRAPRPVITPVIAAPFPAIRSDPAGIPRFRQACRQAGGHRLAVA